MSSSDKFVFLPLSWRRDGSHLFSRHVEPREVEWVRVKTIRPFRCALCNAAKGRTTNAWRPRTEAWFRTLRICAECAENIDTETNNYRRI